MNKNDKIYTPRFCTITIKEVFADKVQAYSNGYTEPTHYHKDGYTVLGKSIGNNRMIFAGAKED